LSAQERQWVLKMVDEMVNFCVAPKPMGRPRKKALELLEETVQSPPPSVLSHTTALISPENVTSTQNR
jgi:hypothetical protein